MSNKIKYLLPIVLLVPIFFLMNQDTDADSERSLNLARLRLKIV